jgi:iron complex transport system permease protein
MSRSVPLVLPLVLAAALLGGLALGRTSIAPSVVVLALLQGAGLGDHGIDARALAIVWQIRLPRVLAGALVGAALGSAGAAYQALFRNPLAAPDLLGVSAGASVGAILAILLSLPVIAIHGFAFGGGLVAVAIVLLVAAAARAADPVLTLVLAGVAVGAVLGAGVAMLKVLADPYNQLPAIVFWLLGSLTGATLGDGALALPLIGASLVVLWLLRWRINVLSLGDEEARTLGVEPRRIRLVVIAAATLMTAVAVSIAGIVGWVGLLVPHVARMLVGPDFRRLLPAAAVGGAAFLVLVDGLARSVAAIEIPLGVLTALVGAPFFLWLLRRTGRGWA